VNSHCCIERECYRIALPNCIDLGVSQQRELEVYGRHGVGDQQLEKPVIQPKLKRHCHVLCGMSQRQARDKGHGENKWHIVTKQTLKSVSIDARSDSQFLIP